MEFKNVIILDVYEGVIPKTPIGAIEENEDKKDLYQEERRLFYVAMTRAKDRLSIVRIKNENCAFVDEAFGNEHRAPCPIRSVSASLRDETLFQSTPRFSSQQYSVSPNEDKENHDIKTALDEVVVDNVAFKIGETVVHSTFGEGTIIAFSFIEGTSIILVHLKFGSHKDMFTLESCVEKGIIRHLG